MEKHVIAIKKATTIYGSDSLFLFNTPTSIFNESLSQLYLFSNDPKEKAKMGMKLYVDDARQNFKISEYAENKESEVEMIASSYFTRVEGKESGFVDWLVHRCGVATFPSLIRDETTSKKLNFTGEEARGIASLIAGQLASLLATVTRADLGLNPRQTEACLARSLRDESCLH
jgi:hypothetical protein